jgi:seryl-tRNA(Sec) selenium transferase
MEEALIARLNRTAPPPVEAVLNLPVEELQDRGETLLSDLPSGRARLVDSTVTTGGGSAPDERFPSLSIELESAESPQNLLATLRELDPPIIGTIVDGKVQLNLSTLLAEELQAVKEALNRLIGGAS